MKKVFVKITWKSAELGGRRAAPEGASYVAVIRFKGQSEADWKKNAWSLRLEFLDTEENKRSNTCYAFAGFLSDTAPSELLTPDAEFELYEGNRSVAEVQVLLSNRLIDQLVAHAA
ncbi:MAG: hypothetical protein K9J37_10635 [Saprospiraceae bacterium]|nr:hypothetical protein [Saprospiraceae bacterium]MCF8250361.1 hypothetical protein [Saprospiraceae bacterium]MCF8280402.1 hypothetical protein [Bacteroidales bacterium]MCF8312169.1 hypothetical protein [Saprospiraceae bacterium]MCF8441867.1 hypothetical protein [Saprospiraceae bacterium]